MKRIKLIQCLVFLAMASGLVACADKGFDSQSGEISSVDTVTKLECTDSCMELSSLELSEELQVQDSEFYLTSTPIICLLYTSPSPRDRG